MERPLTCCWELKTRSQSITRLLFEISCMTPFSTQDRLNRSQMVIEKRGITIIEKQGNFFLDFILEINFSQ